MAHTRHVLRDLDSEWATLASSASAARALKPWAAQHACLADVGTLNDLVDQIRHGDMESSTDRLWVLLELALDDELAARTVLQIVVPGLGGELAWLLRWARRTDPNLVDGGDVDQLLVMAAMEAVRHAAGQRRSWPLSSILRRTHRVLRRETGLEQRWQHHAVLPEGEWDVPPQATSEPSPAEQLTLVLEEAERDGALSRRDAELVWLTRVGGYLPDELAERFGATGDCLRRRRQRAEARLVEMPLAG